jgi:hypothetical protein
MRLMHTGKHSACAPMIHLSTLSMPQDLAIVRLRCRTQEDSQRDYQEQ